MVSRGLPACPDSPEAACALDPPGGTRVLIPAIPANPAVLIPAFFRKFLRDNGVDVSDMIEISIWE
jgi:hypothetical protein